MVAHEIVYAQVYCYHYMRGMSPSDSAQLALKAADQAVAFREVHRPGIPYAHIVTSSDASHPSAARATVPPSGFDVAAARRAVGSSSSSSSSSTTRSTPASTPTPVNSAMASLADSSLPESIGPVIDTTVVERETITDYIARMPGADQVIQDLRTKFGITIQDAQSVPRSG